MIDSLLFRAILATIGMLCGGILGGAIARCLVELVPLDGVFRTNFIVVGASFGLAVGYGAYRKIHSRLTSDRTSIPNQTRSEIDRDDSS